jgi:hypothetical protein
MTMRDRPLVAGELYGLRIWPRFARPRLRALAFDVMWPDGGRALEATCQRKHSHRAPATSCVCGIYAWHPTPHAQQEAFEVAEQEGEQVAGLIAAWGEVEVHETGFRAQYARPTAFLLPTRSHNPVYARWVRTLATSYRAEIVVVRNPDDLARYCADRALGLTGSAVAELLAPARARECQRRRVLARRARGSLAWLTAAAGAGVDLARSDPQAAARRLRAMRIGNATAPPRWR